MTNQIDYFLAQIAVCLAFCVFYHFWSSRARVNAAHLLAKYYDDTSIIGPLAEALTFRVGPVRAAATRALIRLLPRVQEADEVTLTANQRDGLYRALITHNRDLVLAILQSLVLIGDSKAMANMQKLAAGQGVAATDNGVREAAQTALLDLRQRLEAQRARKLSCGRPRQQAHELMNCCALSLALARCRNRFCYARQRVRPKNRRDTPEDGATI